MSIQKNLTIFKEEDQFELLSLIDAIAECTSKENRHYFAAKVVGKLTKVGLINEMSVAVYKGGVEDAS